MKKVIKLFSLFLSLFFVFFLLPQLVFAANPPQFNTSLPREETVFGEVYIKQFSFSDPDSTSWIASINYGDGNTEEINLTETTFTLQHTYQNFGRYRLVITITDNDGLSRTASGFVDANYKRPIGSDLIPPSTIVSSSGFTNTENILVKDDGNFMNKISDTATITVSFDSFSSENNIHSFQVTPYFEASEAPDGLICQASIATDKGVFYANQPFANPNCGYANGGSGDNAHVEFDLPNDVHRIDSLTYTLTSPEGTYFPLHIDYFETHWSGSIYDKPEVNPGGPYEVEQGNSLTLQGTATKLLPSLGINYMWDLDNNGSFETSGQNPVFSTTNLSPGVYSVAFMAAKGIQYTNLLSIPVSTTITITMSVNAGGPYSVNAGDSIQLQASSDDPGNETYTYAWDLDNNGSFETSGQTTNFSAVGLTPGDYTIKVRATDTENNTAVDDATVTVNPLVTPTPTPVQLTALAPAKVWVGLQTSNSNGIRYDFKAEAYKDGVLITFGELDSVDSGGSGFNNANLNTITFNSFSPIDFPAGSVLSIKVSVRNACVGSKNNGKTARLWYNDSAANSRFGSTIAENSVTDYLRDGFVLATTTGTTKKTVDVDSGAQCSAFKTFGTWTVTPL